MTQEEKQLLLKDLCARLPYRVHLCTISTDDTDDMELLDIVRYTDYEDQFWINGCYDIEEIKPYLRPMSSITVEEKEELLIYVLDNKEDCKQFKINDEGAIESIDNNIFQWVYFDSDTTSRYIDWLNKNHFDYRGLIPKGLALEAPEGMYGKEE